MYASRYYRVDLACSAWIGRPRIHTAIAVWTCPRREEDLYCTKPKCFMDPIYIHDSLIHEICNTFIVRMFHESNFTNETLFELQENYQLSGVSIADIVFVWLQQSTFKVLWLLPDTVTDCLLSMYLLFSHQLMCCGIRDKVHRHFSYISAAKLYEIGGILQLVEKLRWHTSKTQSWSRHIHTLCVITLILTCVHVVYTSTE